MTLSLLLDTFGPGKLARGVKDNHCPGPAAEVFVEKKPENLRSDRCAFGGGAALATIPRHAQLASRSGATSRGTSQRARVAGGYRGVRPRAKLLPRRSNASRSWERSADIHNVSAWAVSTAAAPGYFAPGSKPV